MIPENKSTTLRVIIACSAIRAWGRAGGQEVMIKVKAASSSIYKPCLVNRYKLWRNDFCGRLGEPSYLCLVWSILLEENQYIVHPPPATKKNYAVPNLLKAVYGADFWRVVDGETMKKDLEIFSFSRLSKAWGKPTDDVPEKQSDALLVIVLLGGVSLYRKRYGEGP